MAKAIIFGMAASAIGIFSYVQLGWRRKLCGPVLMRRLAGYYLALASCWPAAVRPAGCTGRWRAGFTTGGLGWQRHRLNAARPVLGRYRRPARHPLAESQPAERLRSLWRTTGHLSTAADRPAAGDRWRHFPPPGGGPTVKERMKTSSLIIARIWSANPAVSGGRYQAMPSCKGEISKWSATVRSRSITFRLMQRTTATRCWIFNRMAQPFAI